MRTYLECYPCFLRQALEASRIAGLDPDQAHQVMRQVLELLKGLDPSQTPPLLGDEIHRLVRRLSSNPDPYRQIKQASTAQALGLYPRLKALLDEAEEPLDTALRLSIAGNIIDLAIGREYDLWETVQLVLQQPFAIDDSAELREALERVDQVLYLADNAGETVFDRLLIEELDVEVLYAVKGGPTLNDATREDALQAGLDQVAPIVSTGSDAPGTILKRCSEAFRQRFDRAELVIAKGQANYETLSEQGPRLFFLLQTKCPVIAQDVGVPLGSIVLKQG
ncbi:MAG: DUF89 family protein [Chloroflexia bacterium]|nr:DUF89 family protein [Chloroflexia bacterium]